MPETASKTTAKQSTQVIEPYVVACVQAYWENFARNLRGVHEGESLRRRNLQRMCDYTDACFDVGAHSGGVKLVCFYEFAFGGSYDLRTTNAEIKKYLATTIPGPETEVLAKKAKEHQTYIAACNLENDPEWPETFFNTAFIINPEGKIVPV